MADAAYQADPEVLMQVSDQLINEIEDYRASSDRMVAKTEELVSHGLVGDTGLALLAKVEELHTAQFKFLDEVERVSHGVGDMGRAHTEQEEMSQQAAHGIDVSLH
ncbi:MAG: hypothetical protein E6R04_03180 [Spirochaetes bacterium]|nr:MAG: hypothetical protein E6R04_03180 [Spirochaetota bacterium]